MIRMRAHVGENEVAAVIGTIDMSQFISSSEGALNTWVDETPHPGSGITFDDTTGTYTIATPVVLGRYEMQTTVSDGYDTQTSPLWYIELINSTLPVPPTYQPLTVTEGTSEPIDHSKLWSNVDHGFEWSATGLPTGRSIDTVTGIETGTYQADGTYPSVVISHNAVPADPYQVLVEEPAVPSWDAIPDQMSSATSYKVLDLVPYVNTTSRLRNWMVSGDTNGVKLYQTGRLEVGATPPQDKTLQVTVENDTGVSLPATIRWTVQEGVLYNGAHVGDSPGGATGSVDSLTDEGTLYAACRLTVAAGGLGPYPNTREGALDIMIGKDNAWMDSKAPIVGKNDFTATGLDTDHQTDYHWGYVILLDGELPE